MPESRTTGRLSTASVKAGALYRVPLTFLNQDGVTPIDLSIPFSRTNGAIAQLRKSAKSVDGYDLIVTPDTDGSDGVLTIDLLPSTTIQLKPGNYEWDLRLEFGDEDVWYAVEQTIIIRESISRL